MSSSSSLPPAYELPPPTYSDELEEAILPTYCELYPSQNGVINNTIKNNTVNTPQTVIRKCVVFLCRPVAAIVILLITTIIPLSMVIMGSIHFHQCTLRPFVPLFLVVFGSVCLTVTIVHLIKMFLIRYFYNSDNESRSSQTKRNTCEILAVVFLFLWFIIGIIMTFLTFREWSYSGRVSCSNDASTLKCCDAAVMYFAVIILVVILTTTVLAVVIGCGCLCLISCSSYCNPVYVSTRARSTSPGSE